MSSLESKGWQRGQWRRGNGGCRACNHNQTLSHHRHLYLSVNGMANKNYISRKIDMLRLILFFLTCESLKRIHYTSDSYIHKTSDLRIYLFGENVFVFFSSFKKHSLFVFLQSVTFNLGLDWCERVKWKVQRILLITTNLMVKITLKV